MFNQGSRQYMLQINKIHHITLSLFFIIIFLSGCSYKTLDINKQVSTAKPVISQIVKPVADQSGFKNTTYTIEGQSITLQDGYAESNTADASSSKIIIRYFGNEATGDLDGDDKADVAFLLTEETGGSGTFYYLAAGLAGESNYQGTNAVFLGDRIAPQSTEIKDGKIIVNYADRKANEPFSEAPTFGVSKYFQVVSNEIIEIKY